MMKLTWRSLKKQWDLLSWKACFGVHVCYLSLYSIFFPSIYICKFVLCWLFSFWYILYSIRYDSEWWVSVCLLNKFMHGRSLIKLVHHSTSHFSICRKEILFKCVNYISLVFVPQRSFSYLYYWFYLFVFIYLQLYWPSFFRDYDICLLLS
jgi:hypothetical protein